MTLDKLDRWNLATMRAADDAHDDIRKAWQQHRGEWTLAKLRRDGAVIVDLTPTSVLRSAPARRVLFRYETGKIDGKPGYRILGTMEGAALDAVQLDHGHA